MTDDSMIQALIQTAPKLSTWDRVERKIGWAGVAIAIAALVVASLVGISGSQTALCLNTNLGTRSAPTALEDAALKNFANGYTQAFQDVTAATTPAEYQAALAEFRATSETFNTALTEVGVERAAHPLGRC